MMRLLLLALALATNACSSNPPARTHEASDTGSTAGDTAAAAAGIDSLEARFFDAYKRDDAHALAETYSKDARFIYNGGVRQGRTQMEEDWKAEVKHLSDLKFMPLERVIRGDVAVLTDRFTQQYKGPKGETAVDSGYFVAEVQREADGRWRWRTLMISRVPEKP
jgi:uncharacterized protein (TIGR02246 family)